MLRSKQYNLTFLAGVALAMSVIAGCESGGVGDPCTPEDEFFDTFSGFSLGEVNGWVPFAGGVRAGHIRSLSRLSRPCRRG